jgi:acetyl/propionyl-CoA carboxylase alpha subunit
LETKTRLQVEHPITEAISGVDLFQCMLHVGGEDSIPQDL